MNATIFKSNGEFAVADFVMAVDTVVHSLHESSQLELNSGSTLDDMYKPRVLLYLPICKITKQKPINCLHINILKHYFV